MPAKNATEIVILAENRLGYTHPTHTAKGAEIPLWKARMTQASVLNRKIKENPHLYTWENLELAIEYAWRKRLPLKTVAGLCWLVQDAVKLAAVKEDKKAVSTTVEDAITWEMSHPELPDHDLWLRRLVRSQGRERLETLAEWEESRRGSRS